MAIDQGSSRVTIQSVSAGEQMNLMQRVLKAYGAVTGATGVSITTSGAPKQRRWAGVAMTREGDAVTMTEQTPGTGGDP